MTEDWGWWAGNDPELFQIGPFDNREDAIQEALDSGYYNEEQVNGEWRRVVYSAECCGLHYDCDECGRVPHACSECVSYNYAEDVVGRFDNFRNEKRNEFGYEDD